MLKEYYVGYGVWGFVVYDIVKESYLFSDRGKGVYVNEKGE